MELVPWKYGQDDSPELEPSRLFTFRSGDEVIRVTLSLAAEKDHGHHEVQWDAGVVLADHICAQPSSFWRGKHVFELGAGAGLTAIVLSKLGALVHATDLNIELLRENVEREKCGNTFVASVFKWGEPLPQDEDIDYICMGDCFFGEYDLAALYRTLETRRPGTRILLAYKERLAIEAKFFKKLFRDRRIVRHETPSAYASTLVQIIEVI